MVKLRVFILTSAFFVSTSIAHAESSFEEELFQRQMHLQVLSLATQLKRFHATPYFDLSKTLLDELICWSNNTNLCLQRGNYSPEIVAIYQELNKICVLLANIAETVPQSSPEELATQLMETFNRLHALRLTAEKIDNTMFPISYSQNPETISSLARILKEDPFSLGASAMNSLFGVMRIIILPLLRSTSLKEDAKAQELAKSLVVLRSSQTAPL